MDSFLIKLFGFFLGLLIISILISFLKVKEGFADAIDMNNMAIRIRADDDDDLKHRIFKLKNFDLGRFNLGIGLKKKDHDEEHHKNDDDHHKKDDDKKVDDEDDDDDYENGKLNIPYKGFKFICINTYKDINKLSLAKGKWYDIDNDDSDDDDDKNHKKEDENDIKCKKKNHFKFEKTIVLRKNLLNNKIGAMGADITGIQLNGPDCYYFANNNKNYELTEFSMFMSVYIISCEKKSDNIIFEMTGNTEKINDNYATNIININLIKNSNDNYDIHLIIGNILYDTIANNIDKNIIEKNNNLLIGLLYSADKISLVINNIFYNDTNKNKLKITLGSKPLIINKDGNISMYLYNFVYYKSLYTNINSLIRYNIYHLSGLNNKECPINNEDHHKHQDHDEIKIKKLKLNKVKFNYNDDYEEPEKEDHEKNKTCPTKIKFNLKPTIDRIKDDIELNIKNKVDKVIDVGANIDNKLHNIKDNIRLNVNDAAINVSSKMDRIKSDIETNIRDKPLIPSIDKIKNEQEEKPSFFKRIFNFF
jgi:hypothetical protein